MAKAEAVAQPKQVAKAAVAPGAHGLPLAPAAPSAAAADRVYDAVYAAVFDHRLPPGARLREEELARTFAVSRTLVRQALQRLAQDGVVLMRPNRGAQVPEPTREEGVHVFDARRVVECEVVRRLVGRLDSAQLRQLQDLVDAEDRAAQEGNERTAIHLSAEFHLTLARQSGNPRFVQMLEALLPTSSLLMALYRAPGQPMCVAHDHRALLARLSGNSAAAAATEMRRHLTEIERCLAAPADRPTPVLRDVFAGYRGAD